MAPLARASASSPSPARRGGGGAWAVGLALPFLLAGCAHPVFTEADDGEIKEVSRGAEFSISLPRADSKPYPDPLIQGAFIIVTGRSSDEKAGRDVIELRAEGPGEADIRIPGFRPGQESPAGDYLLRVRVKGPNDPLSRPRDHSKPSYP